MTKKIGVTCDDYKVNKFRKGLLKAGYKLEYDGESGIDKVHLFRIEVDEKDFNEMKNKIVNTSKKLELEFHHSN